MEIRNRRKKINQTKLVTRNSKETRELCLDKIEFSLV